MAGYTRNNSNIATGNVIQASDLNGEFNDLVSAFNATSGHTHDGTSAEGAPITKVGPGQNVTVNASNIVPSLHNTMDLGTSALRYKDAYFQGSVNTAGSFIGAVTGDITGNVTGDLTGDVFASNGTSKVVDGGTDGTDATFTGALTGNVTGNVTGDLTGDVYSSDSTQVLDSGTDGTDATFTGAVTGNASTATALETARSIAGNSFDGSADISIATTDLTDGTTAVTASSAEVNILDGDTTATATVLADEDRVVVNDAGTMAQVALSDFKTYIGTGITYTGDVTIGSGSPGDATNKNLVVNGNLTISGTTTTVNTETINLADNNIVLNSNLDANTAPTEDGGITINRGNEADKTLLWDETNGRWTIGDETFVSGSLVADNITIDGNAITSTDTDGDITVTPNGTGSAVVSQLKLGTSTVPVNDIKDEDDLSSNSDSALATQQSIKAYIDSQLTAAVPAGTVVPYAGTQAPTGWLICDGKSYHSTAKAALYTAIGTTYGQGGTDTFRVPDLRGRVVAGKNNMGDQGDANLITTGGAGFNGDTLGATGGSETHALSLQEMPRHRHTANTGSATNSLDSGTFVGDDVAGHTGYAGGQNDNTTKPHNNVQPTIILNYIIKE